MPDAPQKLSRLSPLPFYDWNSGWQASSAFVSSSRWRWWLGLYGRQEAASLAVTESRPAEWSPMHEFSIADSIVQETLEIATQYGERPVERIRLQVGRLRQIVPASLTFAFEALAQGTLAEGAVLDLEELPIRVRCPACSMLYETEDLFWSCPACGAFSGKVLAGDELILQSVTLQDG